MLGRTLRNRYQIIKFLGQGAFGDTYLAKDSDLPGHPHCVVKHFKPKDSNRAVLPIARRLFDTEAQTLYKLGRLHDQIPTLWAHFEENGEFFFVQDFIAGHDLTQELIRGQKLSESCTITLLHDILEILAIVHQQNVIHRDIKPANLMRRQDGKIVLIDFGAVKEISTIVVSAGGQINSTIVIGTPGYMSSEQAQGKPRLASDIYAVGAIGLQALTGQSPNSLPEDPQTGELVWRDRTQVSDNLANVLDKMVRYNFSQRYQDAGEALQAILSLSPPPPQTVLPAKSVISTNRTRRGLLQLAGLAGVGLVAAVVGGLVNQNLGKKSAGTPNNTPSPLPPPENGRSPSPSPESPAPKAPSNSLKTIQFETVIVNSTGQIANRRQGRSRVFAESNANGISIEMVAIPGGSFVMGSPETEAGRIETEGPQHTVNIAPFFLAKYQVTQAQWRAVAGLPKVKIDLNPNPSNFKGDDLPVEQVNWHEVTEFCARLSQFTGRNYRLPSEAEWEYACRAGMTTPFYLGPTITPDLVNYDGNVPYGAAGKGIYREKTIAVGSFPPNSFGLYDMHGNVWEWCQDVWHDNYKNAPTDGSAWEENGNNTMRLLRGGSWSTEAAYCRAARRLRNPLDTRYSSIGFRVASA